MTWVWVALVQNVLVAVSKNREDKNPDKSARIQAAFLTMVLVVFTAKSSCFQVMLSQGGEQHNFPFSLTEKERVSGKVCR